MDTCNINKKSFYIYFFLLVIITRTIEKGQPKQIMSISLSNEQASMVIVV